MQNIFEDINYVRPLLSEDDYRGFLQVYYDLKKQDNPNFSYTVLSKSAGFSSRSSFRDIVQGRRKITDKSKARVIKALKLPYLLESFFKSLVENNLDQKQTELLKEKILMSLEQVEVSSDIFAIKNLPHVYASLGGGQKGRSIEELIQVTGIDPVELGLILKIMLRKNIVLKDGNQYIARSLHVKVNSEGRDEHIQDHFLRELDFLRERASKSFEDKKFLFNSTSLLVNSSDIDKIRSRFYDLLDQFIEENEDQTGDRVLRLTTGLV